MATNLLEKVYDKRHGEQPEDTPAEESTLEAVYDKRHKREAPKTRGP